MAGRSPSSMRTSAWTAQRGTSRSVVARVTDPALADALGEQVELFFDFEH